jgi:hypothetical protein
VGRLATPFTLPVLALLLWTSACAQMVTTEAVGGVSAPASQDVILERFADLVGGRWVASGQWVAGPRFEQIQEYTWGLDGRLVRVATIGKIDAAGTLGPRNQGIRSWDAERGVFRFWEFDRFGGVTEGICGVDGDVLWHEYEYAVNGKRTTMRDALRKLGPDRYEYKVGPVEAGVFTSVLLEATLTREAVENTPVSTTR